MNIQPGMLQGMKIQIARPYRVTEVLYGQTRAKGVRRIQRYIRFIGWRETLKDGEVVELKLINTLLMNQATYLQFEQYLKAA